MEKLIHCITTSLFRVIMPFDSNDNYARSGNGLLHELVIKKKKILFIPAVPLRIWKAWKDSLITCVAVKTNASSHGVDYCLWLLKDLLLHERIEVACKGDEQICRSWETDGVHLSPSRGRTRLAAYNQMLTSHTGCLQGFPNITIQIWDAVFIIISFKTDLSWSAAAPSVRSGWPWLDRHQPAGSTCGLTAARWSPLQCHHPPCTAPCWCARWWHCGRMKRGH